MLRTTAKFTFNRKRTINNTKYRTWFENVDGKRVWVDDSLGMAQGALIALSPDASGEEMHYVYTEELSEFETHAERGNA